MSKLAQPTSDRRMFPERTRYDQELKKPVHEQTATCCKCGHEEGMTVNGGSALPPEAAAKKFKQRGWDIAARRTNDVCPACVEARKNTRLEATPVEEPVMPPNVTPIRSLADLGHVATTEPEVVVEAPVAEVAPASVAPVVKSNAPRQPSREERRRVMAAVEGVYDVDKKCYVKGHSDKLLGQELNVPWAWVAEIREQFYGPEGSEEVYGVLEDMEKLRGEVEAVRVEMDKAVRVAAAAESAAVAKVNAATQELEALRKLAETNTERLSSRMIALEKLVERMIKRL